MQKFISTKHLYSNIKTISEEVQTGITFVVLKYSKPAYKIVPLDKKTEKKYILRDISNFVFESKTKEKNLATNFKQYLYS